MLALRDDLDITFILANFDQAVQACQNGVQRISQIVADLRNFSRLDGTAGAAADVQRELEHVLRVVSRELELGARISIRRDFAPFAPRVRCNPTQLQMVFMNLLTNAAQAIEGEGTITVATGMQDGFVRIAVSDSGRGIAPADLPRIFDPFFTTKSPGKGTGLGLSVSYEIITKHGGTIDVQSVRGAGTTFVILLPAGAGTHELRIPIASGAKEA
jgi:signal transduction histidine kinase